MQKLKLLLNSIKVNRTITILSKITNGILDAGAWAHHLNNSEPARHQCDKPKTTCTTNNHKAKLKRYGKAMALAQSQQLNVQRATKTPKLQDTLQPLSKICQKAENSLKIAKRTTSPRHMYDPVSHTHKIFYDSERWSSLDGFNNIISYHKCGKFIPGNKWNKDRAGLQN